MARAALPQNYLKETPAALINTDAATRAAATEGGSGGGGTVTTVTGEGPGGVDCWEYTVISAAGQKWLTIDVSKRITNTVGIWINTNDFDNVKKVSLLITSSNFASYFSHDITLTNLEKNGWVFITRPLSQFANQGGGTESWANVMTKIRIVATSAAGATGNNTVRIGPFYPNLSTRPKCLFFFDDANDTDLTEAEAYLTPKGFVGISGIIESLIGTTNYLTTANMATLHAAGWDIVGHHETELSGLSYAAQVAELTSIRDYLLNLGYEKTAYYFVYPGGTYDANTLAAMAAAGMTFGRTTLQIPFNPAISPNLLSFSCRGTSVAAGTTAAGLLAALDDAILNRATFATFSHGIYAGAAGIHTDKTVWRAFIDGVEVRVKKGLVDVVSLTEYLAGFTHPRSSVSGRVSA